MTNSHPKVKPKKAGVRPPSARPGRWTETYAYRTPPPPPQSPVQTRCPTDIGPSKNNSFSLSPPEIDCILSTRVGFSRHSDHSCCVGWETSREISNSPEVGNTLRDPSTSCKYVLVCRTAEAYTRARFCACNPNSELITSRTTNARAAV